MKIDNVEFMNDLYEILTQLQFELKSNRIELLHKIIDGPANVQVCCPYHNYGQERRPSAGISKDTGIFHCFACQEVHTLPEVVSYCFGKNDSGAYGWQWLLRKFVYLETEDGKRDFKIDCSRNDTDVHSTGNQNYVSEKELDSYRYECDYWRKRGIVDEEIIEKFDLGYSISEKMITFPNRNIDGNCLFVAKRSIRTKFFHYPSGTTKEVYGIYELYQLEEFPKEVYITESMIDALRLWQVGKYAGALNGLGNSIQFKQLTEMPNRTFILATDSDEAGMKARDRIRKNVKGKLFLDVVWPKGRKDAGECLDEELNNLQIIF